MHTQSSTPSTDNRSVLAITAAIAGIVGLIGGLLSPFVFSYTIGHIPGVQKYVSNTGSNNAPFFRTTQVVEEDSAAIDVVEKANKAVVSIVIKKNIPAYQGVNPNTFPFNDFFGSGFPFTIVPQPIEPTPDSSGNNNTDNLTRVGGGSGFIVREDGLIVTNRHVVSDNDAVYTVVLSDGSEHEAKVLAQDPLLDVALLKIDAKNLSTLELGDSDSLKIGQTVVAIGYALAEYGNTVTKGVVSGIGRRVVAGDGMGSSEVLEEAIQTDAAINLGNSGGPLLNLSGQVVGVNTAVSQEGQLLGFAIPINNLKKSIDSVLKEGRIVRPWLGVRYTPVTPRLAETNKLPVTYGALVLRGSQDELAVVPGSPADKVNIVENDIILEINGKKLEEKDSLAKEVAKYNVGDEVSLKILHKGEEKTVKVKLTEYPSEVK